MKNVYKFEFFIDVLCVRIFSKLFFILYIVYNFKELKTSFDNQTSV